MYNVPCIFTKETVFCIIVHLKKVFKKFVHVLKQIIIVIVLREMLNVH